MDMRRGKIQMKRREKKLPYKEKNIKPDELI
jgi:hypothetical protein